MRGEPRPHTDSPWEMGSNYDFPRGPGQCFEYSRTRRPRLLRPLWHRPGPWVMGLAWLVMMAAGMWGLAQLLAWLH